MTRLRPLLILLVSLWAAPAAGDQFVLRSGGRLEGQLLNPDEKPRKSYRIQTSLGLVTVAAERVEAVVGPSEKERAYLALLPRMPATADGNWKMAQWCQQNFLEDHRREHLEAAIALDENHAEARRSLGYTRDEQGRWVLPEVVNRKQGLIRHGMRWVLPADIVLQQAREAQEKREKELRGELRRWRSWIVRPRGKEAEGRQKFLSLRDYAAVAGLSEMLRDEDELPAMKLLYIETLHRIGSAGGAMPLVQQVLETPEPEIRSKSLDALQDIGRAHAVAAFTKALSDSDNHRVNRAAAGLAAMEDPESVPALIDALITEHKFQLRPAGGAINPIFGNGPGGGLGGLSMGGNKPKIVKQELQNESVRDALVKLTGVNHGFNQEAWRAWLVRRDAPATTQLRRGE